MSERRLPPVTQVGMTSLALIVIGGIYMAAHLPDTVPLGLPTALLVASALLMAGNLIALARVDGFAWHAFFGVARWSLLAYAVIAGMLAWVFVKDGLSGGQLVILLLSLVVFAVHVPVLMGFTVAREAHAD
jgi:hypothetical protein